jgi:hypothetical protein
MLDRGLTEDGAARQPPGDQPAGERRPDRRRAAGGAPRAGQEIFDSFVPFGAGIVAPWTLALLDKRPASLSSDRLPCRRSRVRVPSAALSEDPRLRAFCVSWVGCRREPKAARRCWVRFGPLSATCKAHLEISRALGGARSDRTHNRALVSPRLLVRCRLLRRSRAGLPVSRDDRGAESRAATTLGFGSGGPSRYAARPSFSKDPAHAARLAEDRRRAR